jgi:hypothetical protein
MSDRALVALSWCGAAIPCALLFAGLCTFDLRERNRECKCHYGGRPQIFIDENTDIPNNPLKPMTVEEFQKLQDELRKRDRPEVGDGL